MAGESARTVEGGATGWAEPRQIDDATVRDLLRDMIASRFRTSLGYAKARACSAGFVSAVLAGKRTPPDWMLGDIGARRGTFLMPAPIEVNQGERKPGTLHLTPARTRMLQSFVPGVTMPASYVPMDPAVAHQMVAAGLLSEQPHYWSGGRRSTLKFSITEAGLAVAQSAPSPEASVPARARGEG